MIAFSRAFLLSLAPFCSSLAAFLSFSCFLLSLSLLLARSSSSWHTSAHRSRARQSKRMTTIWHCASRPCRSMCATRPFARRRQDLLFQRQHQEAPPSEPRHCCRPCRGTLAVTIVGALLIAHGACRGIGWSRNRGASGLAHCNSLIRSFVHSQQEHEKLQAQYARLNALKTTELDKVLASVQVANSHRDDGACDVSVS